jgi:hypothetical protein
LRCSLSLLRMLLSLNHLCADYCLKIRNRKSLHKINEKTDNEILVKGINDWFSRTY